MNSKRKPYKTYTKEFKTEAVRLMAESDRPLPELAAESVMYCAGCINQWLSRLAK